MPGGGHNPASGFLGTTAKPSLGPTFSYLVDATLWLARANQVLDTDKEDLYIVEMLKSRKTVRFPTPTSMESMSVVFELELLFYAGSGLVFHRVRWSSVQKLRTSACIATVSAFSRFSAWAGPVFKFKARKFPTREYIFTLYFYHGPETPIHQNELREETAGRDGC